MLSRAWEWMSLRGILCGVVSLWIIAVGGAAVAQSGGYAIRPGDRLRIGVIEDASLNREVLVLPDGHVSFPLAGSVRAAGRTSDQVSALIRQRLAPNFAVEPTVNVAIIGLFEAEDLFDGPEVDIFALGEVQSPGRKEVTPGITLLQFLAESGGLAPFAADKRIELIRTDAKTGAVSTYLFNYRLPQGSAATIAGNTPLRAGDVVKVPQKRLFE